MCHYLEIAIACLYITSLCKRKLQAEFWYERYSKKKFWEQVPLCLTCFGESYCLANLLTIADIFLVNQKVRLTYSRGLGGNQIGWDIILAVRYENCTKIYPGIWGLIKRQEGRKWRWSRERQRGRNQQSQVYFWIKKIIQHENTDKFKKIYRDFSSISNLWLRTSASKVYFLWHKFF